MPTARPDFATEMVGAQELHMEILDPTTRNVWQSLGPVTRAEYDAFPLEAVSVTGGERMSPAKSLYRHWVAGLLIASFVGCGGGDSTERTVRADDHPRRPLHPCRSSTKKQSAIQNLVSKVHLRL